MGGAILSYILSRPSFPPDFCHEGGFRRNVPANFARACRPPYVPSRCPAQDHATRSLDSDTRGRESQRPIEVDPPLIRCPAHALCSRSSSLLRGVAGGSLGSSVLGSPSSLCGPRILVHPILLRSLAQSGEFVLLRRRHMFLLMHLR